MIFKRNGQVSQPSVSPDEGVIAAFLIIEAAEGYSVYHHALVVLLTNGEFWRIDRCREEDSMQMFPSLQHCIQKKSSVISILSCRPAFTWGWLLALLSALEKTKYCVKTANCHMHAHHVAKVIADVSIAKHGEHGFVHSTLLQLSCFQHSQAFIKAFQASSSSLWSSLWNAVGMIEEDWTRFNSLLVCKTAVFLPAKPINSLSVDVSRHHKCNAISDKGHHALKSAMHYLRK